MTDRTTLRCSLWTRMPPRTVLSASRLWGGVFFRNIRSSSMAPSVQPGRAPGLSVFPGGLVSGVPAGLFGLLFAFRLFLDDDDLHVRLVLVVHPDGHGEVAEPLDRLVEQDLLLVDLEPELVQGLLDVARR